MLMLFIYKYLRLKKFFFQHISLDIRPPVPKEISL